MPVVTVLGLQVALLLSGAVLTETTFNWPGIGYELIHYLNNRDYIAVQGIITVFALVVVVSACSSTSSTPGSTRGCGTDGVAADRRSRSRVRRPCREARGVPRWIAVGGDRDHAVLRRDGGVRAAGSRRTASTSTRTPPASASPSSGATVGQHWFGTNVQSTDVLSRVIYGARTELEVVLLAVVFSLADRRAAGAALGLLRRAGGPGAGADHGRPVRVPLPAAGDRDRVPPVGQVRQRRRHRRLGHHRRLRPAVLPRGPQPRRQRSARSPTSRPRVRSARARAPSSAATCSRTWSRACR